MAFGVILQVAIGLVFVYLLLALFVSAFQELVEAFFRKRAKYLIAGLQQLIGGTSADGDSVFSYLMSHPLINPDATTPDRKLKEDTIKAGKLAPSYIPARNFSLVLLEYLRNGKADATVDDIKTAIEALPDGPKQVLDALIQDVGRDLNKFKAKIETWFDDSMDRVTGFYKRHTQWIAFLCGLIAAIAFNVDSIGVARTLWADPTLRTAMSAAADAYVRDNSSLPKEKSPETGQQNECKTPQPRPNPSGTGGDAAGTVQGADCKDKVSGQVTPEKVEQPSTPATPADRSKKGDDAQGNGSTGAKAAPPSSAKSGVSSDDADLKHALDKVKDVKTELDQLPLPLGWQPGPKQKKDKAAWDNLSYREQAKAWADYILPLIPGAFPGWLITALAVSLGAPFWFDALKLLVNVRAAGPKPARSQATHVAEAAPDKQRR